MKLRIGILADYFMQWMGGAGILLLLSDALRRAEDLSDSEVTLLFGAPTGFPGLTGNLLIHEVNKIRAEGAVGKFLAQTSFEEVCFARDLRLATTELGIHVIGPTGSDLGSNFPIPWISYIPDFQHRHFPSFFSEEERIQRDVQFRRLLANSAMAVANSSVVLEDFKRFYSNAELPKVLHLLPMLLPQIVVAASGQDIRDKFSLPKNYFICCSQQWVHKRHDTVIKAFRKFLDCGGAADTMLVFTGAQSDYRAPNHGAEIEVLISTLGLRNHVKYVGYLPRDEQLAMVQHAVAIVQSSVLEGGPGASGTLEAALLGTPIIASDIAPNRELRIGKSQFFPVDDHTHLAAHMRAACEMPRNRGMSSQEIDAINLAGGIQLTELLRQAAR